jgi:glycerol-3-phosphate dehydrogenase
MNRGVLIEQLKGKIAYEWDIIVIGGGATGLGIALDASSRGYKTVLLEQSDFAKGTSSRSTKLVHGGVRYLAQGDVFLVTEALHERGLILKNAPHITSSQEFVIPIYKLWDAILFTVGLKFYDILAGRLSLGRSRFMNREKTMKRLPLLKSEGLIGGVVYKDGQFDDARLAIVLAKACMGFGGLPLNYIKVKGLLKDLNGRINGVVAEDVLTGTKFNINAKLVINSTGVFADEIIRMDNPSSKSTIRPSQGVHLVLDKSFLKSESAIMIPKTDDGRVLFAIPWYDKVVVGTTDTPIDLISLEPVALEEEIRFILQTAQKYLIKPPERKDVLCIFAGLRPLAAVHDNPEATKEISRRHKIILSTSKLLTITGGKWTTYRLMAEETINKAINAGILEKKRCVTSDLALVKYGSESHGGRLEIYGDQWKEILLLVNNDRSLGELIDSRFPYIKAEIVWILRNEMAVTIEDVLARRTRALFLDARASAEISPLIAEMMALEFGFDENWKRKQVDDFKTLVGNYI